MVNTPPYQVSKRLAAVVRALPRGVVRRSTGAADRGDGIAEGLFDGGLGPGQRQGPGHGGNVFAYLAARVCVAYLGHRRESGAREAVVHVEIQCVRG